MKKIILSIPLIILLIFSGCNLGNLKSNTGKMYKVIGKPYISSVKRDSEAYNSGIGPGDYITSLNRQKIRRVADIFQIVDSLKGGKIDIVYRRKGMLLKITLNNGFSGIRFQERLYPSSLGFVIYDIANSINKKLPYDLCAAIAGDIFMFTASEEKNIDMWNNSVGEQNIQFAGEILGIDITPVYAIPPLGINGGIGNRKQEFDKNLEHIKRFLHHTVLIVHGGFSHPFENNWGIADSISNDTLFAYTIGCGGRMLPVVNAPGSIFSLELTGNAINRDVFIKDIIANIVSLYNTDSSVYGWKNGFKAYEVLMSMILDSDKSSYNIFDKVIFEKFWEIYRTNRKSENSFLYYSGILKRKHLRKQIENIITINNKIIRIMLPEIDSLKNTEYTSDYIKYLYKIIDLDNQRIKSYKYILKHY